MKTIKNNYWNHEYRHYMRDLKPSLKVEIFNLLTEWDLNPSEVSELHEELICSVIGDFTIQGENPKNRAERISESYI